MIAYFLYDLVLMLSAINYAQRDLLHTKQNDDDTLDEKRLNSLAIVLDGVAICCRKFDADSSLVEQIESLKNSIFNDPKGQRASVLTTQLGIIHLCIENNLKSRLFMYIPAEDANKYNNQDLFGKEVSESFPKAIPDIIESGNCLACDNNTAAVFHLMRIVEWGLRALCVNCGFKRIKKYNKKSGGFDLVPIEYEVWELMLNQLQSRVDAKIRKLQRGSAKQKLQEFYNPVLQDIKAIRDAWRNHVMHSRSIYSHADALAIFSHVRELMQSLAKRGIKTI